MIARTWRGRTARAHTEDYLEYLRRTGIGELRATPGNRGVVVFRRIDGEETEFWLISLWETREAIGAFAGDDLERARYYPEDESYLLELTPTVTHYEVAHLDLTEVAR